MENCSIYCLKFFSLSEGNENFLQILLKLFCFIKIVVYLKSLINYTIIGYYLH